MQKFNHRLERCSNFTPNLKLFSSKLHQMIFHRSNRERERERIKQWFRCIERYVSLNIFTGNFLFQTTMFEGRAAVQVFGTGARLLSQSDRGRIRYGWRGHRERAYLPGKSASSLLYLLPSIRAYVTRLRFIIRTRVKVSTRNNEDVYRKIEILILRNVFCNSRRK